MGKRRDDDARVAAATSDGTRAVNGEGSTPAVHALPRPRNSIVRGIAGLAWAFGHRADAAHVGWYVGKGGGAWDTQKSRLRTSPFITTPKQRGAAGAWKAATEVTEMRARRILANCMILCVGRGTGGGVA